MSSSPFSELTDSDRPAFPFEMQKEGGSSRRKRSHEDMNTRENFRSKHPATSPPGEERVRSSSPGDHLSENQTQSQPTPPTSGQIIEKPNGTGKSADESTDEDEDMHLGDSLDGFDWHHLETRYHEMIEEQNKKGSQLQQEFDELMNVRLPISL